MPHLNLDVLIMETASPYPTILGNLAINDYIRGLSEERRSNSETAIKRWQDERSRSDEEKAYGSPHRLVQPSQAIPLYSNWCKKWFPSVPRCQRIIEAVLHH